MADGASNRLEWHVNSGDATFAQAASFIAAMFQELGLDHRHSSTEDLDTPDGTSAGTGDLRRDERGIHLRSRWTPTRM